MTRQQDNIPLKNQDTYVYIDASNIRWACQKTLGFKIDFARLLDYFRQKYPNLKEARYYEGIATDDERRRRIFNFLEKRGYIICPLERKTYNSATDEEHEVKCPACGNTWTAKFTKKRIAMKSNVDVYLATDMVAQASVAKHPTRLIIVSCDGDYAEAIKTATNLNSNVSISVLAVPRVKDMAKNTLSVRLRQLEARIPRYILQDISSIQNYIERKE